MTETQLTSEIFDQSSYHATSLRQNATVTAGNPVFKEVTSEEWALYFPLNEKLHTELVSATKPRFRSFKTGQSISERFP